MADTATDLALLSAMITPAVLISACGTLIFSTSNRLGRIVDRVRELGRMLEQLHDAGDGELVRERLGNMELQLASHAQRGRLIQRSLTGFYVALGFFVATTISIGVTALLHRIAWLPTVLGILGTIVLFYGCVLLIGETRLALRAVDAEMAFILRLRDAYQERRKAPRS
jgi:hypothetical protein